LAKNWKDSNDFRSNKKDQVKVEYKAQTERGRKLAIELRCVACHRFSDNDAVRFEKPASDLSQPVADWSKSCLAERADHAQLDRPIFGTNLNREAIKAYLASRRETKLSPLSTFARGQKLLEQKGCLACHSRHGVGGFGKMAAQVAKFDKDFAGQAPSLVPPSLNAVGDKLLDEALSIAVRGERQPIRMPWLKVRMPKFKHSPDELATLTQYFVEHDRIPADAPASGGRQPPGALLESVRVPTGGLTPPARQDKIADAHTLLAGQALTGVRGWSCIACHKIGDYEPKQVALGARGSDLRLLGKHIRPEFFFRWIASPLRVIPGVEMPQYNRPVAGVLDGDLAKQHAALWQALNEPNFQPPTNPNNVEQLWVVNPGERPRIIRDMFQLPKELGGGNVARSFAASFDNGHSFLFDLDTASLRQWTFGEFARQQVIGKRWFWEMAGLNLAVDMTGARVRLRKQGSTSDAGDILPLFVKSQQYSTEIASRPAMESPVHKLRLGYELHFSVPPKNEKVWVQVQEQITPLANRDADGKPDGGIERQIQVSWKRIGSLINDYEVWMGEGRSESATGPTNVQIEVSRPKQYAQSKDEMTMSAIVRYSAKLDRPLSVLPSKLVHQTPIATVKSVPGFDGVQLPLDASIMPTGLSWFEDGLLAFTSLKGHVYFASDSNMDGLEDQLQLFEEGLTAPFGLLAIHGEAATNKQKTASPRSVLVAHKPEVIYLGDKNGDGRAEMRLIRSGWGFTDDYHEWTTGPVQTSKGEIIYGLSSDYTNKNRPKAQSLWRGKVMRESLPIAHAFRYPTGLAINDRDEVFVSDQQGVQNCFNEINYLVEGAHYGVPATHEEDKDAPETKAAIQIPHPWTRSVNGLVFLTGKEGYPDLKGHGIGCEYNGRFLIRFTTQRVGDVMQGAVLPFSHSADELSGKALAAGTGNEPKLASPAASAVPLTALRNWSSALRA
ncbi:MAG: hypothetical protein IAG10_30075, partial [Planctomycetaceae bacterium]|nr:hypothetical protein [Planctomycetaceae bacterium]